MKKTIISLLLILAMVLPVLSFTGCTPVEDEGYITPTIDPSVNPDFKFNSEKVHVRQDVVPENNTTFKLVEENKNYEFYFNEEILEFALVEKSSGDVWYSNPSKSEREAGIRSEMSSQISLYYLNKTEGSKKTLETYMDCILNQTEENSKNGIKQFHVVEHEGHLRVIYILGLIKPDYIIPTCMTAEVAEEYIQKLKDAGYLAVSKFISGGNVYSKLTPAVWNSYPEDRRGELLDIAPEIESYIKEGQTLYLIGEPTKWNNGRVMSQLQNALVEVGMTLEERNEIDETFGVVKEDAKTFWIPLDYVLTENGLTATIPSDEISFDTSEFAINNLTLLQYFGSASKQEQGYMFVPDGSGAIVNFNNGKTNIKDAVKVQLYGLDDGLERLRQPYQNQNGSLPVFGIKKANSALFAIIESGDTNATIVADIAGKNKNIVDRNRCYSQFKLYEYDELEFASASKAARIYQNEMNSSDISISYTVLANEKANYNGMAEYYRNYLTDKGVLKQKQFKDVAFNIELIGAYNHDTAFLGVGYTEMKAITTFEQCGELIKKLSEAGIKNISVNYKGWANNGLRNTVYNKAKVLKELGGKKGLASLQTLADELGVNLYFETELMYVYKDTMFDGYSSLNDASRMVTRDIAYHYQYDPISKKAYENAVSVQMFASSTKYGKSNTATIVSPSAIYDIRDEKGANGNANKVLADLIKYGVKGVSLGSMSRNLTGNYKVNDFWDRGQVAEAYASVAKLYGEQLNVMGKGVNSYMLPYVDSIFEISNTSSKFNLADASVPFYQMVIHGSVQYSGEPINLNGDPTLVYLQAVEAGSGLYYRWCYEPNSEVKDLVFEGMYSLSYVSWLDSAIEMYKKYNDLLNDTSSAFITAHEILNENVNKVTYSNGVVVYVNYGETDYTAADGTVVKAEDFAKGGVN